MDILIYEFKITLNIKYSYNNTNLPHGGYILHMKLSINQQRCLLEIRMFGSYFLLDRTNFDVLAAVIMYHDAIGVPGKCTETHTKFIIDIYFVA